MNLMPGSQRITGDSIIGPTAVPIRLHCVSLVSGGTASVLSLLNGTTAGGTQYVSITGTASTGTVVNFAGGLRFPGGLFADADGNISSATFVFDYEL